MGAGSDYSGKYAHYVLADTDFFEDEDLKLVEEMALEAFDCRFEVMKMGRASYLFGHNDKLSLGFDFSGGYPAIFIVHNWFISEVTPDGDEIPSWYLCNEEARDGFNAMLTAGADLRMNRGAWTSYQLQEYNKTVTEADILARPACYADVF